ncbi:MAG: CHAT domain-containing tetratricopeptide repeat protein, partial [Planctomycetota bacterium]
PELLEIEALVAAGDERRARSAWRKWKADRVELVESVVPERRLDLAHRLDAAATALGRDRDSLELREWILAELLRTSDPSDSLVVEAMRDVADAHWELGDHAATLELSRTILSILESSRDPDDADVFEARRQVAAATFTTGDDDRAIDLFEGILAEGEVLGREDEDVFLRARENLSIAVEATGDLERARMLQEQAYAARCRAVPPDANAVLRAMRRLSELRLESGDIDGVVELETAERPGAPEFLEHEELGRTFGLASSLERDARPDAAAALLEHTLPHWAHRFGPDSDEVATIERSLANALIGAGRYERALEVRRSQLERFARTRESTDLELLETKRFVGALLFELGDLEGALALEAEALAGLSEQLAAADPDRRAATYAVVLTRYRLGDYQGALPLAAGLHAVCERVLAPTDPELLEAKQIYAMVLGSMARYEEALSLEEEVLTGLLETHDRDHPDVVGAKQNLSTTLRDLGQIERADSLAEEVLAAFERTQPSGHPDVVAAKLNLAVTRGALGDAERALELVREAVDGFERLVPPDHPDLLRARFNLISHLEDVGRIDELAAASDAYLEALIDRGASVVVGSPRLVRAAAARELSRVEWLAYYSELVAAEGGEPFDRQLLAALELLRSLSVRDAAIARTAREIPELARTIEELADTRARLAGAGASAPVDAAEVDLWSAELLELSRRRDDLEARVRKTVVERGLDLGLVTAASIARELAPDEAHVSFWRYWRFDEAAGPDGTAPSTESFLAFVVTPDAEIRRLELGPAGAIEEAVADWRLSIGKAIDARGLGLEAADPSPEDSVEAGVRLRRAILDPILADVPEVRRFRLVLDDALHLVPFDALPRDGGVVGDLYTISAGATVRHGGPAPSSHEGSVEMLVVGGVDYGELSEAPGDPSPRAVPRNSEFVPLPGATAEVAAVAQSFEEANDREPRSLSGSAATKAALSDAVVGAHYVHLATHGWFTPGSAAETLLDGSGDGASVVSRVSVERANDVVTSFLPETLCGLALAGANGGAEGTLTAEELGSLDLTSCELAVLSACETNVGIRRAGQGIQSLQTALHAAGARTAICSLWKVDDAATRRLFEIFYTKLWKEHLGKADALWAAKMALRAEGHPVRDWAGWVLTGAPE